MSKKSKAKSAEKRKKAKRARKKANQEKYQRWAEEGVNTKSKRASKNKRKGPRPRLHETSNCGNPGCMRCSGLFLKPFIDAEAKPVNMPQWVYNKYMKLSEGQRNLLKNPKQQHQSYKYRTGEWDLS